MGRKKSKSKSRKPRQSITGLLAYAIAPLTIFLFGIPGIAGGVTSPAENVGKRLFHGFRALMMGYTGVDVANMSFVPQALLVGWLPIAGAWAVRKLGVNKMAPRSVPVIL